MMDGSYPPGVTGNEIDEREIPEMYMPDPQCEHCIHFDATKSACTREWNNLDESCYVPERDDRETDETCDSYEWDGETLDYPKKPQNQNYKTNKAYMKAVVEWRIEVNKIKMEELAL